MPYRIKKKTLSFVTILIGLMTLGVFGFAIDNMRDLLFGTPLKIQTLSDGTTVSDGFLPIIGNAKHSKNISINGRSLFIDREGNFVDGIVLSPGYNIVEIALLDQFDKEKIKTYHLVFDQIESVAWIKKDKPKEQEDI